MYPPPGLSGKELQRAISGFVWERITTINPKVYTHVWKCISILWCIFWYFQHVGNPISATMIINRHAVKIYKSKVRYRRFTNNSSVFEYEMRCVVCLYILACTLSTLLVHHCMTYTHMYSVATCCYTFICLLCLIY